MSARAIQLSQAADGQITELIELVSARGEDALSLPCPGREKLGDGSVAACATHAAENYLRIASFIAGQSSPPDERHGLARRLPRFLRARGHTGGHSPRSHGKLAGAGEIGREDLIERLSTGRQALASLAELTDAQLDQIPAASDMKFCDGQRTLEQIVRSLLDHQAHQVDAVRGALA